MYCPICKNRTEKFLPFGAGAKPTPNRKCPHCGSLERDRFAWLFLERRTQFFIEKPNRFLHIAPERVFEEKFRRLIGNGYLTADLHAENVDMQLDITKIPFRDDLIDFVYCSHVQEHIVDDYKAISELKRVLNKNGHAIIMVPISGEKTFEDPTITDPKERLRVFKQADHVRIYGHDFIERLKSAKFMVNKAVPADFLSSEEIAETGLFVRESLFYCSI